MNIRASVVLFAGALLGFVVFTAPATAAVRDSSKALTCEGRCERLNDNCLKRASGSREAADCQFEHHACVAKCGDKH